MDILSLIGRSEELYVKDLLTYERELSEKVNRSKVLIVGAAGTIGQAVTQEIFKRNPKVLHVVDINENNLVELVRDLRSSIGYIDGEFKTFCLDAGDPIFAMFVEQGIHYDYVLNLSAMKHVRSERDKYTLLRMIKTNVVNALALTKFQKLNKAKHFCVSTDKAANPENLMGATKTIMENLIFAGEVNASMARFANVAFSDGSLLHGFNQRIAKGQPISAPYDVKRFFVTPQEAGELCLFSTILGKRRQIFFPKDGSRSLRAVTFSEIATKFLDAKGLKVDLCDSEDEARAKAKLKPAHSWPCYFFKSDTTGEKPVEEFTTKKETILMDKFHAIGIVQKSNDNEFVTAEHFLEKVEELQSDISLNKQKLVKLFEAALPELSHKELHKSLDERM